MNADLVSVVVPIYNVEKYLDRCISSIVSQTYRNLEIILVDDGSPDRCPQICEEWAAKDDRIKVIHKANAGLGMARNTGIEHATGKYVCFFDSDDYIDPTTVEKTHAAMIAENAQITVFGLNRVSARGEIIRTIIPEPEKSCFRGEEVQKQFLPDLIDPAHALVKNRNMCLSAWSALYSVDLVRSTGWRFVSEREMISEDSYSLIWLYSYVQSVAVLQEPLYYYCENGASLTQTYREDRFWKVKDFYQKCIRMAAGQGYEKEIYTRIAGLFLAFSIAAMKQIVAATLPKNRKVEILSEIVDDSVMQGILHDKSCQYRSKSRRILFWFIKRRLYSAVYMLLKLQILKERRQ